jgi:hypothetical protein
MLLGVPVALILAYALFRAFEHYGLKIQQAVYGSGPRPETNGQLLFLGAILLPARAFGLAVFVWYGLVANWWAPLKLLVIGFPISLAFQFFSAAVLFQLPRRVFNTIVLTAIPITAAAMAIILSGLK